MLRTIPVCTSLPKIGVSSCLMGNPVRYDGTDKRNNLISQQLDCHFDMTAFCPEVAIGLGIPRETIMLVGTPSDYRAVGTKTAQHDVTQELKNYAQSLYDPLKTLSGYIVKSRSPSCGWHHVNLYPQASLPPQPGGLGVFIAEVLRLIPELPVIDEEQLAIAENRQNFFERVYALHRWQQLQGEHFTVNHLMLYHSQYKYNLMARGPRYYQRMGQIVANCKKPELIKIAHQYRVNLLEILSQTPKPKHHANVLQHLMGYFKKQLSSKEKVYLQQSIDDYSKGQSTLSTPINLLRTHLQAYPNDYLSQQAYLFPYPETLEMLTTP